MTDTVKRETVQGFDDNHFSTWQPLDVARREGTDLPACYEIAISKDGKSLDAVVYGGATVEGKQRANQYYLTGSHIKKHIEEAKAAGYEVFMRMAKFADRSEAFMYEQKMLKTFDYAWNSKDQANKAERRIEEIVQAAKTKKGSVYLKQLSIAERVRIKNETKRKMEADKKEYYEDRLKKAEADPKYMDKQLKPRNLVFKGGKSYDATKPLEEQLDMRVKLNKLYVERMKKTAPEKLLPAADKGDVYQMQTRSKAAAAAAAAAAGAAAAKSAKSTTSSVPLKKDNTPDMRFSVNKQAQSTPPPPPPQPTSQRASVPLKKDNTPDMRFAVNRQAQSSSSQWTAGPLKKDNTPDMRYASNRAAVQASSYSSSSSASSYGGSRSYGGGGGPLTKSGRPDMRYKSNW